MTALDADTPVHSHGEATPVHDQVAAEQAHETTVVRRNDGWLRFRPTCAKCGPLTRRWVGVTEANRVADDHMLQGFPKHGVRS